MPPKKASAVKAAAKSSVTAVKKPATNKSASSSAAKSSQKPAAAGGKGATSKQADVSKAQATVKGAKKWTKEDEAARKIQSIVRGFLARRLLKKKRKEREKYEQLMEQLEREAFTKMVKMHQEKMEIERQKEEEERKKRQEMAKKHKRMLEAAFDGDNNEIRAVLKEIKQLDDKSGVGNDVVGRAVRAKNQLLMIECVDANNNTPLSEAAGGGHADTIKLLIELGANPNSQGQFLRTPLYRAAFSGHVEAVQVLLQHGADPRIYAEDGQTPAQQSSFEPIRQLINSWDVSQTDTLLRKLEAETEKRRKDEQQRIEVEAKRLEDQVDAAEKLYVTAQKKLIKTNEELNKRVYEHDSAVAAGYARTDVTLQMVHDTEMEVEVARLETEKAREKLAKLKLALRDKRGEGKEKKEDETFASLQVLVKELDDVLMRDIGDRIKNSNKWPLIIDMSGQAATFLRYRDTNYINALSPRDMEPNRIRLSILGALRYGKPLVLDMMEVDMYDACETRFDEVYKGLLQSIINKKILHDEIYVKLIRSSDGPEYSKNQFNPTFLANFKFFIITKNPFPPQKLVDVTYPITVCIPNTGF